MILTNNSVELLAHVGNWDVLEAAIAAGADAVYLGGKLFNMRMHRTDVNFDDILLEKAIIYAHKHNVRLYVTVNNLVSEQELDNMRSYLQLLEKLQPDALLVQDLAILELARELKITIPLHASVMMNTHNKYGIGILQEYGVTRVVVNREMTLEQLALLKEQTGIEVEYFMHGDMCIAHSGQCLHSGVVFGQSSNRGRCLKSCRWPYQLIDTETDSLVTKDLGPYKLAIKDMCMYRNLPELIQSGVCSFKIEGRMRTADFVKKVVAVYRRAIDSYIADPTGYTVNEKDWQELYDNRTRDFSNCYALGNPGASAIGYSGEREPRSFSQAVKEAGMKVPAITPVISVPTSDYNPMLSLRVADLDGFRAACQNGANVVYIGGESFRPAKPWTLKMIEQAIQEAAHYKVQVIITTPRITTEQESKELQQIFHACGTGEIRPHGLMVSNIGMLHLARQNAKLPIQTDFSLNVFNHLTVKWLKANGVSKATLSLEATLQQILSITQKTSLPLEIIVHGPMEAMVLDHSIPNAIHGESIFSSDIAYLDRSYALRDTADQDHPIKIDQYGRNHILFAKDLCLLPYLGTLATVTNFRIEAQHYTAAMIGIITNVYRQELNQLKELGANYQYNPANIEKIIAVSPRDIGIGPFLYQRSR